MSTIKNQILLFCYFNKIIKGPRTSQFPGSRIEPKTCYKCQSYSTLVFEKIPFSQYVGFKRNKHKCNFYYEAMPMMMSQILKFIDFTKTQKSICNLYISSLNRKSYYKAKNSFQRRKPLTHRGNHNTLYKKAPQGKSSAFFLLDTLKTIP